MLLPRHCPNLFLQYDAVNSASLVMPNSYARDEIFNPHLTTIEGSYIAISSLGEEGAGLCASRTFVCLFCACKLLPLFPSSWGRGLAAVCDCGIPWTFLLTFLQNLT